MKRSFWLILGLVTTATNAFAQVPPQIFWETDATATNLAFSADGATMYTGGLRSMPPYSYGNIKKWDVSSRTELFTLTSGGSGPIGLTNALAVIPDGTAFASGHGSIICEPQGPCRDFAVGFHVWNAASGAPQFALGVGDIDGLVESVAFSQDGEFVAFVMSRSNEEQVRVYDYPEYTLQGTYAGHGNGTYCAAFSPTDNLLATGGWDGTVRLWDVETHQLVRTFVHGSYTNGGYPISVAFSPDGSQLAVSGSGYNLNATVWDVSSGDLVYSLEAGAGAYGTSSATVAFSPSGRYLVAGVSRYVSPEWGGLIRIWDMADGSLTREYTEETVGSVGSPLFVAVSPVADDWIAYTYDHQVKFADTGLGLDFRDGTTTPSTYCTGKTTSEGCQPFMDYSGSPSVSSTGPFQCIGRDVLANTTGILLYSSKRGTMPMHHGGFLCVKSPFQRTPGKTAKTPSNGLCPTATGRFVLDFQDRIQGGLDPTLTAGAKVFVQFRGRDIADPAGFGDSLTDGMKFTILP